MNSIPCGTDYLINPRNDGIEVKKVEINDPITFTNNNNIPQEVGFCFGNFTGNLGSQLMASRIYRKQNYYHHWYMKINLTAPVYNPFIHAIDKITNGLGKQTRISYCPFNGIPVLSSKQGVNGSGILPTFPVIQYTGAINVVTAYEQEVNQGLFLPVRYYYFGAKYHKIGKGFLGFDEIIESNDLTGAFTNRYFNIDNDYYHIINNNNTVKTNDEFKKLISEENRVYDFRDMSESDRLRYFPYLVRSDIITYDLDGSIIKSYRLSNDNYDDYGNPQLVVEKFGTNGAQFPTSISKTINYKNLNNSNIYLPGLIEEVTARYRHEDTPDVTRVINYEYYENTTGLIKSKTIEKNDPKSYTIHYEYDDGNNTYGNLTEGKYAASGLDDRINSFTWSDDGRFKMSYNNPENHLEEYTYYENTALLKTFSDPNNLITTYEYDPFGKIEKVTYPNGSVVKKRPVWSTYGYPNQHEDCPPTACYYQWSQTSGEGVKMTFFDQFKWNVRDVRISLKSNKIYQDRLYLDTPGFNGLLARLSVPFFSDGEPLWVVNEYDELRRPVLVTRPDQSKEIISYNGNSRIINGFDGQKKEIVFNGAGWITGIIDNDIDKVDYKYAADGQVEEIMINNKPSTTIKKNYDIFGQLDMIDDPDNGTTTYEYNAFGDLEKETDEISTIDYECDKLGRMTSIDAPDGITQWQYDTQEHGIGKLHSISRSNTEGEVHFIDIENTYNELGYLIKQVQLMDNSPLQFEYDYDVYGRQKRLTWPSGYQLINAHDDNGLLVAIHDNENRELWRLNALNAREQIIEKKLGDHIISNYQFDPNNGLVTGINASILNSANSLQDITYQWHESGNLTFREDNVRNLKEKFVYDNHNRLRKVFLNNTLTLETNYNGLGNITTKSDAGTYAYGQNDKPHAVTAIQDPSDYIGKLDQDIEYPSFDKVKHIEEKENGEIVQTLDVSYGPYQQRTWQKYVNEVTGKVMTKKYFNAIYEQVTDETGNMKQVHYLAAPDGLFGIFTIENDEMGEIRYILKDHLGSISTILDEEGVIEQELSFDAWGRRRDPVSWSYYDPEETPPVPIFDRGFTMHEHLYDFKLINMNGRMYDPVVGHFLSPDPFVQMPEYSQNFNRYSYVLNNPLRFTDPSGFVVEGGDSTKTEKQDLISFVMPNYMEEPNGGDEEVVSFCTDKVQFGSTQVSNLRSSRALKMKARKQLKVLRIVSSNNNSKGVSSKDNTISAFPEILYSKDTYKGTIYVSDKQVVDIFSQSVTPKMFVIGGWAVSIFDLAKWIKKKPSLIAAPILLLDMSLQIEDWNRESILKEYNSGPRKGMLMNYSESIQDWNGYLHIDRSTTLIDASTGKVYGKFNQNYLPK